jgi:hypothetical protein
LPGNLALLDCCGHAVAFGCSRIRLLHSLAFGLGAQVAPKRLALCQWCICAVEGRL